MKYLKLYENFNNDEEVDTRKLLEDILSLSYILEDEGIIIEYWVSQNLNDNVNRYLIGTSDDIRVENGQGEVKHEKDIKVKIENLEKEDDFPNKIFNYEIKFITKNSSISNITLINDYFNKLTQNLEESFNVELEKESFYAKKSFELERFPDYKYNPEVKPYCTIIKVFVEKTADDYGKNGPEEEDLNNNNRY